MEEVKQIRGAASFFFAQNPREKTSACAQFSATSSILGLGGAVIKLPYFENYLDQNSLPRLSRDFSSELCSNGYLTCGDFMVYFYLCKTRPTCQRCQCITDSTFFTCIDCFTDLSGSTYDFCGSCSNKLHKKHVHGKDRFVSNYDIINYILPPKKLSTPAKIGTGLLVGAIATFAGAEGLENIIEASGVATSSQHN